MAGVRGAIGPPAALVDGRSTGWGEDDLVDQAAEDLGGFDPGVGSLQRLNEAVDFLPVELGHAGMQEWGRLGRRCQLGVQLLAPCGVCLHLVPHLGRGHALHDHLDQLLAPRLDALELMLGGGQARAVLHPEAVHLPGELITKFVEEFLIQQPVPQRGQHSPLDFVTPDRQPVGTRA